jgi:hypothetical protein
MSINSTYIPVVFTSNCQHCKQTLDQHVAVWAFGHPYYMLIHKQCAPFFKFSEGYPHKEPFEYYLQKSNENIMKTQCTQLMR